MKQRLNTIREIAFTAKEMLSEGICDHQEYIFKLDKIIRGTVFVKWLHRIAAVFFILFGALFVAVLYPSVKPMLIMTGIAMCGYGISLLSIFVQIKLYERTLFKVQAQTLQEVSCHDLGGHPDW